MSSIIKMQNKDQIVIFFLVFYYFTNAQVAPVPQDDTYTTEVNTALEIVSPGILGNDSDGDGDPLTVTGFQIEGTSYTVGKDTSFSEGNITINADGSFRFEPSSQTPPYSKVTVPIITYTVSDGTFTDTADLALAVNVFSPVAQDDYNTVIRNSILYVSVLEGLLSNDTDTDGNTLTVTGFQIEGTSYNVGENIAFSEGNIVINADGSFSFQPSLQNLPYSKVTVPIITYTVSDGIFTDVADLVLAVNVFLPVAKNDYDTVEINTPLNVNASEGLLSNDTDADDTPLNITYFLVSGTYYNANTTVNTRGGAITINADGSFTFVPNTNYAVEVPSISYIISDGIFTSNARLYLTVERVTNLLKIKDLSSCNQGFTKDGEYKIFYNTTLSNESNAKDYHENNLIKNINLTNDLNAIFGSGCVTNISVTTFLTSSTYEYTTEENYPNDFDISAINSNFLNGTSSQVFNTNAINNFTLYPRQSIHIGFCVTITPFCGGRPNSTPSGSGINFDQTLNVTSSIGNHTENLLLSDFHTTEAIVTAGLYIPNREPTIYPDGTFDYVNTVIITNEGTSTATNVNYNMGLEDFFNSGIRFSASSITKISGPSVTINNSYNGNTNTQLLLPNNSLAPGETIILEVFFKTKPFSSTNGVGIFRQMTRSQTQGGLDGFDESTEKKNYSYVTWSDSLGDHLDRYYRVSTATETASSTYQCICSTLGMSFSSSSYSSTNLSILNVDEFPKGILEHKEITYQIIVRNTSPTLQLDELQLTSNLISTEGDIVSVSAPSITSSDTDIIPNLNPNFNGERGAKIFDGKSGLLKRNQFITIQFTVLYKEDYEGKNEVKFKPKDPSGNSIDSQQEVFVIASTDTDNDSITNVNDLDDDNDTIPDTDEYNGLNPLDDDDTDLIPNYRDLDFGVDTNLDGIVDVFDFDFDGVPNHFDLDSDNDGIFDIVEAGNDIQDSNNDGRTNAIVGNNGLDNTLENKDTKRASILYNIPNTDATGNVNFLDIDSDDDGIVDNIEAQLTNSYIPPDNTLNESGIDTVYSKGLKPIDTENDGDFDYIDTNSDNDIRDDRIEGWDTNNDGIPETIASNSDLDNDGLDDAYDTDNNLVNPTNGQTPLNFPNIDNIDNPERDWREIIAIVVLITDVSKIEGEDFLFTISLVKKNDNSIPIQSASDIDINISTINGTDTTQPFNIATEPYDYNKVERALTIPPLTETANLLVTSFEDNIYELQELFSLNGGITSNNTINNEIRGIGTIIDNDEKPSIAMNNTIENEGVDLIHIIRISHPSSTPILIEINTIDDLAISPNDYIAVSEVFTIEGTVNPSRANTEVSFIIATVNDNLNELDQELLKVIGAVTTTNTRTQDLIKTATILDIDPYPIVYVNNSTVSEGDDLEFIITLLNSASEPMRNYLPIDLKIETIDETTTANLDYKPITIDTFFPAYTSMLTQSIRTIDDLLREDTETMLLMTTVAAEDPTEIYFPEGIGTIIDNDFPNLFSPNSDGKSDVFKIFDIEGFPNFKLIIVDRWGSKVYDYSNNGRTSPIWWNGTNNGFPVPEGVYFYILDFNDGITKPRTNFIQLIR